VRLARVHPVQRTRSDPSGAPVPAFARHRLATALVGVASATLLLGSATAAQAAAPRLHTVTLDEAFAAMPVAKLVPGDVGLVAKLETPGAASLDPCPQLDLETLINAILSGGSPGPIGLTLKSSQVIAAYEPAHSKTPVGKTASWNLGAVVFHSAKLASTAAAKLAKIEKACPKTVPPIAGFPPITSLVRTHSAAYAVDGWTGYQTVDEDVSLNLLNGPDPTGTRSTRVFLTRGNVMVTITEQGVVDTGTGVRQEAWRSTVTRGLLTSFDTLIG
jgi:hypothetical protein